MNPVLGTVKEDSVTGEGAGGGKDEMRMRGKW